MSVQFLLQCAQALDMLKALHITNLGLIRAVLVNLEGGLRLRKNFIGKIGVENDERLTGDAKRQLHAGKDDQPLPCIQLAAVLSRFLGSGLTDERYEGRAVVIGDGNRLNTSLTASGDKFRRVGAPFIVRDSMRPSPPLIARCVNLEVALKEVRAPIH